MYIVYAYPHRYSIYSDTRYAICHMILLNGKYFGLLTYIILKYMNQDMNSFNKFNVMNDFTYS